MKKIFITLLLVLAGVGLAFYAANLRDRDQISIVSLGDSVAVGSGLTEVDKATPEDIACGRSKLAYPVLLANATELALHQFACSGAKTSQGLLQPQQVGGSTIRAQLERAKPHFTGNIIVLSIGANDVGWSEVIRQCAQTDCTGNTQLQTGLEIQKQALHQNLELALKRITAERPRQILLSTYYRLLDNNDTCLAQHGITAAKQAWLNSQLDSLNNIIATSAEKYAATVVKTDFSGHLLCDKDVWLQGMFDGAPLHPNHQGQQRLYQQHVKLLRAPA